MVPQHAHAHSRPQLSHRGPAFPQPHPDPVRIAGISGTLALNIVALLLLLVPVSQTAMLAPADGPVMPIRWIEDPPKPPVPPPPVEVEIVTPQPVPQVQRQTVIRPQPAPSVAEPAIVEHGSLPPPPLVRTPPGAQAGTDIAAPQAGMRLEYAHATAPPYPGAAIRNGLQGTVMLEVLVDVDGSPLEVRIHRSSGHRVLDDAARRHVLRAWSFRPATRDGQPIQAIGIVPIDFHLDRG